ncbi:MAG TPA: GNAT family N-acetyltransferase [Solirubrobacteraceae bacterium]|jgi:GNAT superfamily N-acetyltransferase|nr:GNAT family N-acetyltransferase [Solirubrobacteraceae bacterium]
MPAAPALRAAADGDADAVAALLRARERDDLGTEETTVADVRAEWAALTGAARFDAWVAEGEQGLDGYALAAGPDLLVVVHPRAVGRGVGRALRETAERQARARGARVVRQFIPAANTRARVHLLEAGWWPVHHYFRMRIDLDDAPPRPPVLARVFDPARDAEEVWHLIEGAYSEVEGHLPQSFESWRATGMEKPGWDPAFWLLQHDARGIVGAVLGERGGKGERRTGIITAVAVADRARGRGHGHTLVGLLLHEFRAARLRHAETSVHGRTTAAARVFEAAGMRAARHVERWEKVLGV